MNTKSIKNKIKVVDSIMGQGKTTWAINYMKDNPEERFIYITPYLDEVERVKENTKGFIEPKPINGSKLEGMRRLTYEGKNIISTHSLMGRFDLDIQENIKVGEYTLILDEVAEVINEHKFYTKADKEDFFNYYAYVDEDNYVRWNEEAHPIEEYTKGSKFYEEMVLCLNGNLVKVNDKLIMWELPVNIFQQFKEVYILTYLFEGSIQKPYFDSFNVEYEYLSVKKGELISYEPTLGEVKQEIKSLINLVDTKLNNIGEDYYAFSATWFKNNVKKSGADNVYSKVIKKNTYNFFNNYCKSKATEIMWSTFNDYRNRLKGRAYGKDTKENTKFVPFNIRATNDFAHKRDLAYLVNVFPHTSLSMYFSRREDLPSIDLEAYALSILIQWIWRSRIRRQDLPKEDRQINLYIPSSRMRSILTTWLDS